MPLESDLLALWDSYQPILEVVEKASPASNLDELKAAVSPLFDHLVMPQSWQLKRGTAARWDNEHWYNDLLLGEVVIPLQDGRSLTFVPDYFENKEAGAIYFDSLKRKEGRSRISGYYHDDCSLTLHPAIRPAWQRDTTGERNHVPDYRTSTSEVGGMATLLEGGDATFISHERVKLCQKDAKKNMLEWKDGKLVLHRPLQGVLIFARMGYPSREEGKEYVDEEFGKYMDSLREGYAYVKALRFAIANLGQGELDLCLKHLGLFQ